MPHILDAQIPEVNPTGAPGGDFENIKSSPEAFGGFGAQAEEKFGAGLEKAGTTGIDLATQIQSEVNDTHAAQLQTGYARESTDLFTKYDGLQGQAKMSALPQFKDDLGKLRDKYLSAAPSLQEKTRLAPALSGLEDRYYYYATAGASHAQTQYFGEVARDKKEMHGGQALLSWSQGDPQGFYNEVANAAQETRNEKEAAGLDEDSIETEAKKTRGVYVTQAIKMSLAQGDPHNVAPELANKYKGLIDPASMVQINGLLNDHRDQKASDALSQKALATASATPPVTGAPVHTAVPVSYLSAIQKEEGFDPVPKWDVHQWTVGYGTKAAGPNERPSKADLDARFHSEIGSAAKIVDGVNPNLDPGTKAALTSLTYNTGDGWTRSGLGAAIRSGDLATAQKSFLQYSNVAGMFSPAIAQRRQREASWFGQSEAPAQSGPSAGSNVRSSAYQVAMSDPAWEQASPKAQHETITKIKQAVDDAEVASNQDTKAKKNAADHAAGGYITKFFDMQYSPNPDFTSLRGQINHDPALADYPNEKAALMDRVLKASAEDQSIAFGPGYRDARAALFSDPDTPGHANTVAQFANDYTITTAGLKDLSERFKMAKSSPDRMANEKIITSFLTDAKQQMVHDQDIGTVKIPDPKGAHLYNSEFVPRFVKQAAKLQEDADKTGNTDKLDKFLSRENVDKMINEVYPATQRNADRISALSAEGVPEPAGAPLPPPPEGFNEAGWKAVVGAPPLIAPGQPMPHAQWSQALEILGKNPTPEVQAAFNRRFGAAGVDAGKIAAQMLPQAAGAPPSATPAAPAAPIEAPLAPPAPVAPTPNAAAATRRAAIGAAPPPTAEEIHGGEAEIAARRAATNAPHAAAQAVHERGLEQQREGERDRLQKQNAQRIAELDRQEAEIKSRDFISPEMRGRLARITSERAKLK